MKINLIPEEKQKKTKVQNLNFGVTFVVVTILVILTGTVVFLFSLNLAKRTEIKTLDGKITEINKELEPLADLEKNVLTIETKLKDIKQLFTTNSKWSKFFPEFERILPKEVKLTNLSLDKAKSELTARVNGSVVSAARTLKAFQNTRTISISGKTAKENIKFNLSLSGGIAKDIISDKDGNFDDIISQTLTSGDYQISTAFYDSSDNLQPPVKIAEFKIDSDLKVKELEKSEVIGFDNFNVSFENLFESVDLGSQITENEGFTLIFKLKPGVLW